jgi:hypothetical protein
MDVWRTFFYKTVNILAHSKPSFLHPNFRVLLEFLSDQSISIQPADFSFHSHFLGVFGCYLKREMKRARLYIYKINYIFSWRCGKQQAGQSLTRYLVP